MNEELRSACDKMEAQKFRHLPVTDLAGRIVGILSDRDLKRAMRPDPNLADKGDKPRFRKGALVSEYMSWPAQGVDEHTPVGDVVRVMLTDRISSLLILAGPQAAPVGIVTTDDLLRLLLRTLDEPGQKARLLPVRDFFDRFAVPDGMLL